MKTNKFNRKVSHRDVRDAVKNFLENGGIIVKLPEQKNQPTAMVGGEKYQDYEAFTSLFPAS